MIVHQRFAGPRPASARSSAAIRIFGPRGRIYTRRVFPIQLRGACCGSPEASDLLPKRLQLLLLAFLNLALLAGIFLLFPLHLLSLELLYEVLLLLRLDLKLDNLIKLNQLGISISTVHGLSISFSTPSAPFSSFARSFSTIFLFLCARPSSCEFRSVLTSYIFPPPFVSLFQRISRRKVLPFVPFLPFSFLSFTGEMTKPRPLVVVVSKSFRN